MNSETGYVGAGLNAKSIQPDRPLDRLGIAAERIERLAYIVADFNDRFQGCAPVTAMAGPPVDPRPPYIGYHGNIHRMFDALDKLDAQISNLSQIG